MRNSSEEVERRGLELGGAGGLRHERGGPGCLSPYFTPPTVSGKTAHRMERRSYPQVLRMTGNFLHPTSVSHVPSHETSPPRSATSSSRK